MFQGYRGNGPSQGRLNMDAAGAAFERKQSLERRKANQKTDSEIKRARASWVEPDNTATNIGRMIHAILQKHGFRRCEIEARCKTTSLVICRQEICFELYTKTDLSLLAIGRIIGRDHSTVHHSVEQHKKRAPRTYEIDMDGIVNSVAAAHSVTVEDMCAGTTHEDFLLARNHAYYELRRRTLKSVPEIADYFGIWQGSVWRGIKRHEARIRERMAGK